MEGIMAVLTDEQQALVGSIAITGISAHRAGFARVMCVYLDCHRTMQKPFVGNHALQFSKRPLGGGGIGTPLLLRRFLALLAMVMAMSRLVAERVPFFCKRFLSLA